MTNNIIATAERNYIDENGDIIKVIIDEKHQVGVILKNEEVDKSFNYDKSTGVFQTGVESSNDVPVAIMSKKHFMEWYRLHTPTYPIKNHKGVVDSSRIIRLLNDGHTTPGFDIHNVEFHIRDYQMKEFPFKMNYCEQFLLETPELQSLKNTPRSCRVGKFGVPYKHMNYMDCLIGGPTKADFIQVFTDSTFLNLETSLEHDLKELVIEAPNFASFEGLNVNVDRLAISVKENQSFKNIHKQLNNKVKMLHIHVGKSYVGGVLPFAKFDSGIVVKADISGNPPVDFVKAMEVVEIGRSQALNVHDIQEKLIDAGLEKFACF